MQINSKAELDAAIIELEKRRAIQEEILVAQFKATRESLTPMNLIKDGFNKLTDMPGFQNGLIKAATGVGVVFLSKKLLIGKSSSILKKALAGIVEFAVAKSTISNTDKIKALGISIYHNLFKKSHKNEETHKNSPANENGSSARFKKGSEDNRAT